MAVFIRIVKKRSEKRQLENPMSNRIALSETTWKYIETFEFKPKQNIRVC